MHWPAACRSTSPELWVKWLGLAAKLRCQLTAKCTIQVALCMKKHTASSAWRERRTGGHSGLHHAKSNKKPLQSCVQWDIALSQPCTHCTESRKTAFNSIRILNGHSIEQTSAKTSMCSAMGLFCTGLVQAHANWTETACKQASALACWCCGSGRTSLQGATMNAIQNASVRMAAAHTFRHWQLQVVRGEKNIYIYILIDLYIYIHAVDPYPLLFSVQTRDEKIRKNNKEYKKAKNNVECSGASVVAWCWCVVMLTLTACWIWIIHFSVCTCLCDWKSAEANQSQVAARVHDPEFRRSSRSSCACHSQRLEWRKQEGARKMKHKN